MTTPSASLPGGTWNLGDLTVTRFGYGAMQLAGPGVMGPPADRQGALAVLREAVRLGITHIDTADAYGPHVTNELIREALHPYPAALHLVTKVGAVRTRTAAGLRRAGRRSCAGPSRRTWTASASTHWTSSTCGWATRGEPSPDRLRNRSTRSSTFSVRA